MRPASTLTPMPRGFQLLTPEQRRAIASQGGKAAHQPVTLRHLGTRVRAHHWTSEEAREAGAKAGSRQRDRSTGEVAVNATHTE